MRKMELETCLKLQKCGQIQPAVANQGNLDKGSRITGKPSARVPPHLGASAVPFKPGQEDVRFRVTFI